MELKKEILEALNDQLNAELESAYIYQAMAAMFEEEGFPGFAAWMDMQALEEQEHARKFYDFINERGGRVKLAAISEPPLNGIHHRLYLKQHWNMKNISVTELII